MESADPFWFATRRSSDSRQLKLFDRSWKCREPNNFEKDEPNRQETGRLRKESAQEVFPDIALV
jgi:hypothetical protein